MSVLRPALSIPNPLVLPGGINSAAANATTAPFTPGLSQGNPLQISATEDTILTFITAGGGTNFGIFYGPTSAVAFSLVSGLATVAGASYTLYLPAGWYCKYVEATAGLDSVVAQVV